MSRIAFVSLLALSSCVLRPVTSTSYMHPDYGLQLADNLSWRMIERGAEFVYLAYRHNVCCLRQGHGDSIG